MRQERMLLNWGLGGKPVLWPGEIPCTTRGRARGLGFAVWQKAVLLEGSATVGPAALQIRSAK